MAKMTEQQWRKMNAGEQADYLAGHPITFTSKRFMDTTKKVGDYSAVSRKYRALIGGVVMSSWHDDKDAARRQANDLRELFEKEAADG